MSTPPEDAAPTSLPPPEPPSPYVSSGTVTSDGNGGWTWEPDPSATYSATETINENGVPRKATVAEAAVINPPVTLAQAQAAKVGAITASFAVKIAAGLSYQGLTIDIDDGARADLGGMALTAVLAGQGAQHWPAGMSRGWIARGGTRLPLPNPSDGLALANAAAAYYSELVQHEQDLQDDAQAATDVAGLAAVDETAGWPT